MNPNYYNPVAITFGAGALSTLPGLVAGRKCVLVTFPEAEALGLVARVRSLLGDALAGVESGSEPNPEIAGLAAIYERFWKQHAKAELVVAVGGGSVLDTAQVLMTGTAGG